MDDNFRPTCCYIPVAFFGGPDAERPDDVWINGERYRKIVPNGDSGMDWLADYKEVGADG